MGTCNLCGEPMPAGEEMFKFHGYSGPCPAPPMASTKTYGDTDRVIGDIRDERNRQQNVEGWTTEHDDEHDRHELALAAFSYLGNAADIVDFHDGSGVPETWPWHIEHFKPKSYRRDLVRAAALIVAEIERVDRAAIVKLSKALPSEPSR